MNEDILKEIKSTIPWLVAAAIAVGAYYGVRNYRASAAAAASEAVVSGYTTEEIEETVSKFGDGKSGAAIKIRLAKKYYDAGRYDEAIRLYDEIEAAKPEGFGEIPVVGRALCLEGQGKFAEARKAFDDFAAANPKSPFALTARLGAVRAQAQTGDKAGALKTLAAMKSEFKEETPAHARVLSTEDCVKRSAAK